jgi:hypothetical protein
MPSFNFTAGLLLFMVVLPGGVIATQRGFQGGLAGTGMLPTCMNTWLVLTRKMCGIASIPLILIGIALASSSPESVPFILGMMLGVPLALALVFLLITAVAAPIVYNFGAQRRAQRAMADSAAATADPHQPLPTIERSQAPMSETPNREIDLSYRLGSGSEAQIQCPRQNKIAQSRVTAP